MTELRSGAMEAAFSSRGAELQRLRWRGMDLLWDGDPAWWGRRAPLLFPIVGQVKDHRLPQHGFARDLDWDLLSQGEDRCCFRLQDAGAFSPAFPHPFDLRQEASLEADVISFRWTLANPGPAPLTASLGFHPAFRWPLPGGDRKEHALTFEAEEGHPIRRLQGGLLSRDPFPSPIQGRHLALRDELFQADALILDHPRSRRLRFTAPGAPVIELSWDFPHFALWTKPGAPFLCLEPWQGFADPEDFEGPPERKPGAVTLAAGESRSWSFRIQVREALP